MNKAELEALLVRECDRLREAGEERWTFVAHNVPMQAFTNEAKDRMRIMAVVDYLDNVGHEHLERAMRSNFHTDPRYCIHEDKLYAAFVHPLSRLSPTEVIDALRKVASLVSTFGTRYASGPLRFQWPRPDRASQTGIRRRTVEAVQRQLNRRSGTED